MVRGQVIFFWYALDKAILQIYRAFFPFVEWKYVTEDAPANDDDDDVLENPL